MKLPELGVQKPVTTLMFFLAVFVMGAVMLTQLPVDLMPEIEQPTVTVVTTWEGASAEDVESKVTKVVERALGTVNNLEEMTSATIEGISSVTCEFAWGTQPRRGLQRHPQQPRAHPQDAAGRRRPARLAEVQHLADPDPVLRHHLPRKPRKAGGDRGQARSPTR